MADEAELGRLRAAFRRPFAEQLAAWRLRFGNQVGTATWQDLWQQDHDRAFVVAGAMKADLLADLAGAVDKAISQGTTLDEFRRDFRRIVAERGWHGWTGEGSEKGEAWRTRVIYQTNIRTSYMAGRHAQLVEGNYAFWVYRHGGSREPRLQHLSWNGVALPPDHPFWATHYPPNGWGCSCRVFGARSEAGIRRVGGDPRKSLPPGWDELDPRTGAPAGIDRGWAYPPGGSVAQDISRIVAEKVDRLPEPLGDALSATIGAGRPGAAGGGQFPGGSLAETAEAAVERGIARQTGFVRGMPLSGVKTVLTSAQEVTERFGLDPLTFIGGIRQYPFGSIAGDTRAALAMYIPSTESVLVRSSTLSDRQVLGDGLSDRYRDVWQDRVAQALPEIRERAAAMPEWRYSPVRNLDMLIVHEMGHRLHFSRRPEVERLLHSGMWDDGWALLVGLYAQTMPQEFFTESFVLYLRYPDQHFRLHPELLAYFRSIDRRVQ